MGSMAPRGKRKAGDEGEHLAWSLALATLELIFLFLCPEVLQRLFLICCTAPTPGTKLCCQCCQLGMELVFCD